MKNLKISSLSSHELGSMEHKKIIGGEPPACCCSCSCGCPLPTMASSMTSEGDGGRKFSRNLPSIIINTTVEDEEEWM